MELFPSKEKCRRFPTSVVSLLCGGSAATVSVSVGPGSTVGCCSVLVPVGVWQAQSPRARAKLEKSRRIA